MNAHQRRKACRRTGRHYRVSHVPAHHLEAVMDYWATPYKGGEDDAAVVYQLQELYGAVGPKPRLFSYANCCASTVEGRRYHRWRQRRASEGVQA